MEVFEYIDKYGKFDFKEKPFNEVDNIIFCALSYINYSEFVKEKITLQDAALKIISDLKNKKLNIITIMHEKIELLKYIKDCKRYKDVILYNYCYKGDSEEQFSAISFSLHPGLTYVAFEGTDHLVSGWQEDFKMSYMYPVMAQKSAIKYLNQNFTFSKDKIIVGGHSKGGNLAVVASMEANFFVKRKIINVYTNDGPGVLDNEFNSKKYKSIESKIISIIPNYSIVGLILNHPKSYKVIKSSKKGLMSHNILTWEIDDVHLKEAPLSKFSQIFEEGITDWLNCYDNEERKMFFDSFFDVLRRINITDLNQVFEDRSLFFDVFKGVVWLNDDVKQMTKDFMRLILDISREYSIFTINIDKH